MKFTPQSENHLSSQGRRPKNFVKSSLETLFYAHKFIWYTIWEYLLSQFMLGKKVYKTVNFVGWQENH